MTAIRKHVVDFVAIVVLLVLATGVSAYILSNQRLTLPSWVPLLGKNYYDFNGEFSTGQAVTPGQGQSVNVAGVNVGEISKVTLRNGKALLGLEIHDKNVRVYKDATMLLRPKTGLKDMTVELNPGHPQAGRLPEGGTIPVGQTQPDVNLDELLSALDDDTRQWLTTLVANAGTGLKGRGKDLGDVFRTFGPTAKALERINGALATRRENIKRVMHNFSLVAQELGDNKNDLARFVDSNAAALRVLAQQEAGIRGTLQQLPAALRATRSGLQKTGRLTDQLGPAFRDLLPGARALGPMQRALRPFLRQTTPAIRDAVRPLVRETRPVIAELRPTINGLSSATNNLFTTLKIINSAVNILAYNPKGNEEGYLFWLTWANHLGANVFNTQDAHGPIRRGTVVVGCDGLALLDQVAQVNPTLQTLIELTNLPRSSNVCGQQQGQTGLTR